MSKKPTSKRAKRTLGFKLLVGVSVIALALLSSSFALVFNVLSKDTQAITYELQSNQAQLTGLRFSSVVEAAINTLKSMSFENQRQVENAEVFEVNANTNSPERYFEWKTGKDSFPPSREILSELLTSGIAYAGRLNENQQPETHLFYLSEGRHEKGKLIAIRAKLNLSEVYQKASGTNVQIFDRKGEIIFDAKNPSRVGKLKDVNDPLLQRARQSRVSQGTLEYQDSDSHERTLGTYVLSGFKVITTGSVRFVDAMSGTYLLLERITLVGFILLGIALIIVVVFSIGFTAPIAKLTEATQVISEGNFEIRLPEHNEDEIGLLARSMNTMSGKIQTLLIDSIAKVKVDQEIAITSELQKNLIPPQQISGKRYQLRSHYQPAEKCGGDYWGFVETNDKLTLLIADATGHGLPSAMLTATTHGCFAALQKLLTDFPQFNFAPSQMLSIANEVIVGSAKSELNMTMFIAQYDFKAQTLTYANAGHNWPYLIQGGNAEKKIEQLRAAGQRLGETSQYEMPKDHTVPFKSDDILMLYTDGLLENADNSGTVYGKNRLKTLLHVGDGEKITGMDHIANDLETDLQSFYQGKVPEDDVTYVLFQNTKGGNA